MAAEIDGERVATYPDLIVTLAESDGMPTPAAHREPGERIVVLAVPRDRIPLGAGVLEASVYRDPERLLGIELVTPRRRLVTDPVLVGPGGISPADVVRAARELALVELSPEVEATILAGRAVVDRLVAGDRLIYGLNTGLGHMRDHRVPLEVLQRYQRQMIEAHASGIGPPLDTEDVRAAMLARVSGAARGGSGLTLEAVRLLVAMLNAGVHPIVPSAGSVGAGDLMHMAAIASVMIGKGEAELNGEPLPAAEALARAGLTPIDAQPKEGLALVASNGVAIGAGALVAEEAQRLARLADLACALSLEAVSGNPGPFDEAAGAAKAIPGQVAAAAEVRALLEGSYLHDPATVLSVQDPLSFRVAAQVNGAYREQVTAAERAVEVELNGIGDNPMVLIERDTLISNGNFQPMQLALAFDALRTGAAHVAMISERRMNKLTDDPLLRSGAHAGRPHRRGDGEAPAARARAVRGRGPAGRAEAPGCAGLDSPAAARPGRRGSRHRRAERRVHDAPCPGAARHDPDLRGADGDRPDGRAGRAHPRQRNARGLRERASRLVEAARRRIARGLRGGDAGRAALRERPA